MNSDVRLLNEIHKNCITAINAMSVFIKKAEDNELYDCLFEQMSCYGELANEASKLLEQHDCRPEQADFFDKTTLGFALYLAGVGKMSAHRLSKILISGSVEGIYDIAGYINICTDADESSRRLAFSLMRTEEENINKMSEFL